MSLQLVDGQLFLPARMGTVPQFHGRVQGGVQQGRQQAWLLVTRIAAESFRTY